MFHKKVLLIFLGILSLNKADVIDEFLSGLIEENEKNSGDIKDVCFIDVSGPFADVYEDIIHHLQGKSMIVPQNLNSNSKILMKKSHRKCSLVVFFIKDISVVSIIMSKFSSYPISPDYKGTC